MYRQLLPLILLLTPINLYALSCPNNGKIVSTGDTKESVIATCGEPLKVIKKNNDQLIDGKLVYTKASGGAILTIKDAGVYAIKMSTPCTTDDCPEPQAVNFYTGCDKYVYIGNNLPYVYKVCGEPTYVYTENSNKDDNEWLIYPSDGGPNALVIHNGLLADWDDLAYP